MRQMLVLALVIVAGMSTAVVAQEGTVRKLTPAEQAQLDTDNKGRATAMTAAQWLARRSGGNQAERKAWEPTPPPADPRDFTGLWQLPGGNINLLQENGEGAPFTPEEAKRTQQLIDAEAHGAVLTDAASQCFPHGVPRLNFAPYPIRFAYLPGEILMLHEVGHNLRLIHLDRKEAPKDTPQSFLGYSVGHWEGDTLVVETSHFNDKTPLDFHSSHGTKLKVTERFQKQKTSQGYTDLVVHITIDDPEHFTRPFTVVRHWPFRSDMAATLGADGITEYSCEENNRNVETTSDGRVIIK
ncbi:MAG TPA: hypothetical protein VK727_08215 [Steroidobacteraceae bacterium]|jgi:hypothetical protein|nr:hypothetical protein [Steroidobacteraceae bacterium]